MKERKYCQSCSMPLDDDVLLGTNKDGSLNQEYCRFCYRLGDFTHPDLNLAQMKAHLMKIMDRNKLPQDMLEEAISRLPHLKRWKRNATG